MMKAIRTHLGVKLFVSYFAVVLVGVIILAVTVPAVLPQAFNRHLGNMGVTTGMGMMGGNGTGQGQGLGQGFGFGATQGQGSGMMAELYDGLLYHLYVFKRLNDIRIVLAPPESIGAVFESLREIGALTAEVTVR